MGAKTAVIASTSTGLAQALHDPRPADPDRAAALVRSLSLAPDYGIIENIGDPLPFELPYWRGEHPAGPDPYPLPFHPLQLGERALVGLFGFYAEGLLDSTAPEPTVDAWEVELPGFRWRQ